MTDAETPHPNLVARRATAIEHRDQLAALRAATVLEGGSFELAAELAEAEAAVVAFADAEALAVHRERARAELAEIDRKRALRQRIRELDAARLAAVERAEQAARDMAVSFSETLARSDEICACAAALGRAVPVGLSGLEPEKRLAAALTALLSPLGKQTARFFGDIELTVTGANSAETPWLEIERPATAAGIAALTKEQ